MVVFYSVGNTCTDQNQKGFLPRCENNPLKKQNVSSSD